jgi:hypothetical protein
VGWWRTCKAFTRTRSKEVVWRSGGLHAGFSELRRGALRRSEGPAAYRGRGACCVQGTNGPAAFGEQVLHTKEWWRGYSLSQTQRSGGASRWRPGSWSRSAAFPLCSTHARLALAGFLFLSQTQRSRKVAVRDKGVPLRGLGRVASRGRVVPDCMTCCTSRAYTRAFACRLHRSSSGTSAPTKSRSRPPPGAQHTAHKPYSTRHMRRCSCPAHGSHLSLPGPHSRSACRRRLCAALTPTSPPAFAVHAMEGAVIATTGAEPVPHRPAVLAVVDGGGLAAGAAGAVLQVLSADHTLSSHGLLLLLAGGERVAAPRACGGHGSACHLCESQASCPGHRRPAAAAKRFHQPGVRTFAVRRCHSRADQRLGLRP